MEVLMLYVQSSNAGLMLAQRRRRWPNIRPALGQHFYLMITTHHYSVKRSDVTRWKQGYITPPLSYLILWNAVTSLGENKVI